jgi:two-component system response regulator YesN
MSIKVVLADDDFLVRDTLRKSIDWNSLGMELAAIAKDGQEALDFCLEMNCGILLTDIKMPVLSGLDVAFMLLEQESRIKIIFISGIQDFDYARTALNIQAAAYILKPIRLDEVIAALKKAGDIIEIESNRESVMQRMQERLAENITYARETFLRDLLLGAGNSGEDGRENLKKNISYLELPFDIDAELTVAVLEIDDYLNLVKEKNGRDIHLLNFTIKHIIEEAINNYHAGSCCMLGEGKYAAVFNNRFSEKNKMQLIMENISEMLKKYGEMSISVGIGSCACNFQAAPVSCEEALAALKNKFFTGPGSIIHFGDIAGKNAAYTNADENSSIYLREAIIKNIRTDDEKEIAALLEGFMKSVFSGTPRQNQPGEQWFPLEKDRLQSSCIELLTAVYQEFCKTEGKAPEILERYIASMQKILQCETLAETEKCIKSMVLFINNYFILKYNQRSKKTVERIKDYIVKMRGSAISLNDIAKEAYMSASYMCAVFKKETGKTLNEYIIEDKMNYAKELLKTSRIKIYEVAEQLGYESSHYFSYSFKRYTGITPQQFRVEYGKQG